MMVVILEFKYDGHHERRQAIVAAKYYDSRSTE